MPPPLQLQASTSPDSSPPNEGLDGPTDRPRISAPVRSSVTGSESELDAPPSPEPVKRPRGRPRKTAPSVLAAQSTLAEPNSAPEDIAAPIDVPIKRPRGRPRKSAPASVPAQASTSRTNDNQSARIQAALATTATSTSDSEADTIPAQDAEGSRYPLRNRKAEAIKNSPSKPARSPSAIVELPVYEDWEVSEIVDERTDRDVNGSEIGRSYLIRWKGYRAKDDEWVDGRYVNAPRLLQAFFAAKGQAIAREEHALMAAIIDQRQTARKLVKVTAVDGVSARLRIEMD